MALFIHFFTEGFPEGSCPTIPPTRALPVTLPDSTIQFSIVPKHYPAIPPTKLPAAIFMLLSVTFLTIPYAAIVENNPTT